MKVLVIGGGIGGLVTALSLASHGIEAHVYEAASAIEPLGVGINLLPHAVRRLDRLGAMEPLLDIGIETAELAYFNNLGQQVWREPRGRSAGYSWPQISISRGALQVALRDVVRRALGDSHLHLGHRLVRTEQPDDSGVIAHFVDPNGRRLGAIEADALVGADGIHSAVRKQLHPAEGPPHWNGGLIFRAVSQSAPFLSGRTQFMAGGRQTFIAYSISKHHETAGRSLTNWAARFFVDTARGFPPEDWNRRGRLEDFLPRYLDWRFDWLDIPALIGAAEAVYEFPMVDRDPLERWSEGRVTLLGDAAHAMVPLGSNGASQAILDAHTLGEMLGACRSQPASVAAALLRYEAERRPRTTEIVANNRRGGPERVIRIAEERAPNGFAQISDVMSHEELARYADDYKRIASFDIASVNG